MEAPQELQNVFLKESRSFKDDTLDGLFEMGIAEIDLKFHF